MNDPGTVRRDGETASGRAYIAEFGRFRGGSSHLNCTTSSHATTGRSRSHQAAAATRRNRIAGAERRLGAACG
jgi:hypothetical protein